MALVSINELFPGEWSQVQAGVAKMREGLWGTIPSVPAFDISGLEVPREMLLAIREKNRRRIRDQISDEEMLAEDSPFRTDSFIDDQLVEVMSSIQDRYRPEDFVAQHVLLIQRFLNVSAAFRTGVVQERIDRSNADQSIAPIQRALASTTDADERHILELLVMDLTYGGEEPWVSVLGPTPKQFVDEVVARQSA
jgi:hypothetical protein